MPIFSFKSERNGKLRPDSAISGANFPLAREFPKRNLNVSGYLVIKKTIDNPT